MFNVVLLVGEKQLHRWRFC